MFQKGGGLHLQILQCCADSSNYKSRKSAILAFDCIFYAFNDIIGKSDRFIDSGWIFWNHKFAHILSLRMHYICLAFSLRQNLVKICIAFVMHICLVETTGLDLHFRLWRKLWCGRGPTRPATRPRRVAFRWVRVPLHKKSHTPDGVCDFLVETTGLEPVTSCV